jgi:hypothetical protein
MLPWIQSYFTTTSVPHADSALPDKYSHYFQAVLDELVLDTYLQNKYDITMETCGDSNQNHILVYPKYHHRDPTVYSTEIPIDFFFKITIVPTLQTVFTPSKITLKIHVHSIEKEKPVCGTYISFELHPQINREPEHTQTIPLDANSAFNVHDILSYISVTSWNIDQKIMNNIPELSNIPKHYCANCHRKLQVTGSG